MYAKKPKMKKLTINIHFYRIFLYIKVSMYMWKKPHMQRKMKLKEDSR